MTVWVLEPIDTKSEDWDGARKDVWRFVVVANSDHEAREIVANSQFAGGVIVDGNARFGAKGQSPWRNRGASTCTRAEEIKGAIVAMEPEGWLR